MPNVGDIDTEGRWQATLRAAGGVEGIKRCLLVGNDAPLLNLLDDVGRAEAAMRARCHAAALEVAKRFDGGAAKKAHRDMAKGARAAAQALLEGT